jgi:hypothetical protein
LSCAWGTGGQKGGFINEQGETLQRCAKSVEAITSELQAPISLQFWQLIIPLINIEECPIVIVF